MLLVDVVLLVVAVVLVVTVLDVVVVPSDGHASPAGRGSHTNVTRSRSLRVVSLPAPFFTIAASVTTPFPSRLSSFKRGTTRSRGTPHAEPSSDGGTSRAVRPPPFFTFADAFTFVSPFGGVHCSSSSELMQAPIWKVQLPLGSAMPSRSQDGSQSVQTTTTSLPSNATSPSAMPS